MSSALGQTVVRLKNIHPGDVASQVSSGLSSIAGQLADGVQNWASKTKTAAKNTDKFVRSSPWQAVGAIALAGLAAGIVVSWSAQRARRQAARLENESTGKSGG